MCCPWHSWILIFQILAAQPEAVGASTVSAAGSVVDAVAGALARVSLDASVCDAAASSTMVSASVLTPAVYLIDDRTRFVWVTELAPLDQPPSSSDSHATVTAVDDTPAFGACALGLQC